MTWTLYIKILLEGFLQVFWKKRVGFIKGGDSLFPVPKKVSLKTIYV